METTVPGRPAWTNNPLNVFLNDIFPAYRTKLGILDVNRLRIDLNRSHEAVYKWLRKGKLTPQAARDLCILANNDQPNVRALKSSGKAPPRIEDFTKFLFA